VGGLGDTLLPTSFTNYYIGDDGIACKSGKTNLRRWHHRARNRLWAAGSRSCGIAINPVREREKK